MAISDAPENRLQCICGRCPTHVRGGELLFCAVGKSESFAEERGCLCRTCPVHIKYSPRGRFYCLRGAAR
jgi:hypothetical protein